MLNIKEIRNNPELFTKGLADRNLDIDIKKILDLDKKNRELIQKKEKLEQEKKSISKTKDKTLFNKSKKLSEEIDGIIKKQATIPISEETCTSMGPGNS